MKIFNLGLAVAMAALLALDWANVSDTENRVASGCDTQVAYDKSGDLFCVDSSAHSVRLAGVAK